MRLTLALLLAAGAASGEETQVWACAGEDGDDLRVSLWLPSDLGAPVHCVDARTVEEGRLCAPDGGWGLYASPDGPFLATGPGVPDHDGLWIFAHLGPSQFVASASRGTRPPLALEVAGETFWRLRLDLATGAATAHTRDSAQAYNCVEVG